MMTTACHVLPFVLTMTMTVLFVNPLPNGLQPRSDLLLVAAADTDGHVSFWNANRDASKPSDGVHLHRPVCIGASAANTACHVELTASNGLLIASLIRCARASRGSGGACAQRMRSFAPRMMAPYVA